MTPPASTSSPKKTWRAGATAGEQNLYLRQGGRNTFIATLDPADVDGSHHLDRRRSGPERAATGSAPTAATCSSCRRAKRWPKQVADYDNTDAVSGEADHEVYLYEAGGELRCVSCNPSGARPVGQRMQKPFDIAESSELTNTWAGRLDSRLGTRACSPSG